MTDIWTAAFYSSVGGIAVEVVALFKLRKKGKNAFPDYLASKFYWITTILMIAVSAVITSGYVVDGQHLGAILCMNTGATAPLIIGNWTKETPEIAN